MPYGLRTQGGIAIEFLADTFRLRFAAKLRELAEENDWPGGGQAPFAELVTERSGIPMKQPRVSDLLRGTKRPSLQEVEMIALGLGVSPGWLAFEDGKQARAVHRTRPTETVRVPTPAEKAAAERLQRKGRG